MKASIICNETSNEDVDSTFVSVQWKGSCPQIVEGIQVNISIYLHEYSMADIGRSTRFTTKSCFIFPLEFTCR